MASSIQRLAGPVAGTVAGAVLYTNATGGPVILYSINAVNNAGAAAAATAYIAPAGTAGGSQQASQIVGMSGAIPANTAASNAVNLLPARTVMQPNDVLIVATSATTVDINVNGVVVDPEEGVQLMAQL